MMSGAEVEAQRAAARTTQAELAEAEPPFAVIACPGSGKTRLIVDRHVTRATPPRRGRAITAFTRVAAAEVHKRCNTIGRLDLVKHPHFIDTLDRFLWVHLVPPFLPADRTWQRLESWRDAPSKQRRFRCGQQFFRLDDVDFHVDSAGCWSATPKGPARWQPVPTGWHKEANSLRRRLAKEGYLTGAELRAHACSNLTAHGPRLGAILASKYTELIVDEAQDCSPVDLHILQRLYDLGVPIILVADPDQAIYGFRGAEADDLRRFAEQLGRRDITSNWRSTSMICRAAATLRASGRAADIAVADHHAQPLPILLYDSTAGDAAAIDFLKYAAAQGISSRDCLVLAHAKASLPKTLAGPTDPPTSETKSLAWAAGILTEFPAAPSKIRDHAQDILTRTVLRWWYPDADTMTVTEILAAYRIDPATVERCRYRILDALPPLDKPMADWVSTATDVLNAHPPASGLVRSRARLSSQKCGSATARRAAKLPAVPAHQDRPRLDTIHQAKGGEAEAVLVCIPDSPATGATMRAWLTGQSPDERTAEALRVLYVAVTRARRLLGLALPPAYYEQLADHLQGHRAVVERRGT